MDFSMSKVTVAVPGGFWNMEHLYSICQDPWQPPRVKTARNQKLPPKQDLENNERMKEVLLGQIDRETKNQRRKREKMKEIIINKV